MTGARYTLRRLLRESGGVTGRGRALSTVRGYQSQVRLFCEYAADPRYEWTAVCQRLFGSHPAQVCFEWNTAVHASEYEGRPARRALPAHVSLHRRIVPTPIVW